MATKEPLPLVPNPSGFAIDADEVAAIQLGLRLDQRKAMAPEVARRVNQFAASLGVAGADLPRELEIAREIEDVGYVRLGTQLDAGAVADVVSHFATRSCFNAHVYAKSDREPHTLDELAESSYFACYRHEDVITAPHLLELANHPKVLSAVGNYLGCVPTLYSMNAWWSFPRRSEPAGLTQEFHRDEDDYRNCVLFVYLTDATSDGFHEYIRYSHRQQEIARRLGGKDRYVVEIGEGEERRRVSVAFSDLFTGSGYGGDAVYRALLGDLIDSIGGRPGEAFLSDPDGLHRARHPEHHRRLIAWIRYGLARNRAYMADRLSPVPRARVAGRLPDTARSKFINRLVVTPE